MPHNAWQSIQLQLSCIHLELVPWITYPIVLKLPIILISTSKKNYQFWIVVFSCIQFLLDMSIRITALRSMKVVTRYLDDFNSSHIEIDVIHPFNWMQFWKQQTFQVWYLQHLLWTLHTIFSIISPFPTSVSHTIFNSSKCSSIQLNGWG